jgi:hypothetical protein
LAIYGKTDKEITHVDAIHMRLKVIGLLEAPTFPVMYRPFTEHQCTLIEPFRRSLKQGENVTIRMRIPNATTVRIHNGDEAMSTFGFENEMLVKELVVQGDVIVHGIFDRTEQSQLICKFYMA